MRIWRSVGAACLAGLAALVGLVALAAPAGATTVIPADLGELARDARAVVRGRVMAIDGRWTDDRRTIETIVTLAAEAYMKGSLGATVQFRVPGGDLGRYRSIVVGAPQFEIGERVVLFLGANGPSIPYIVGFNQGVFRVAAAADGSGLLVIAPSAEQPPTRATVVVRGEGFRRAARLEEFEAGVRILVGVRR